MLRKNEKQVGTARTEARAVAAADDEGADGLFARLKRGLARTRRGFVRGVSRLTRRGTLDEDTLDELEELLIEADIGVQTATCLVDDIRSEAASGRLQAGGLEAFLQERIRSTLVGASGNLAAVGTAAGADAGPTVFLVVGVNGAGKTTTIGKLARKYSDEGKSVLVAAGDTFRAAAIDQLAVWAERIGVDLIRHQEGSDPAAVVYDAIQAATSRRVDVVLIDTAGRLQNKVNLMKELSKVERVIERELGRAPDEVLLVLDATTGQNALSQAKHFKEAVGVTGIALTKLDGTAKGGIVVAIAEQLEIPVKLIGVGESAEDLRPFEPEPFVDALFAGDDESGS